MRRLVIGRMACSGAAMLDSVMLLYGVPFAALKVSLWPAYNTKHSRMNRWALTNNASLYHSVLMAQVMTRMQLTWLGEPGPYISTKNTFKVVIVIIVAYFVYATAFEFATAHYEVGYVPVYMVVLKMAGSVLFSLWALYSLCRTRESTRARYSIEEEHCRGCEDLCCSFWCSCCTVAQLARHTGEYETYPGVCCSETGLPRGAPLVV